MLKAKRPFFFCHSLKRSESGVWKQNVTTCIATWKNTCQSGENKIKLAIEINILMCYYDNELNNVELIIEDIVLQQ